MVDLKQEIKVGDLGGGMHWVWAITIAVVLGGLYYFLWPYQQQQDTRRLRQAELDKLTAEVLKAQKIADRHDEFKRDVARLEETFKTLLRILPVDRETPELLKDVQGFVTDTNLVMERFTPALTARQKDFYSEWPIKLQLRGSYNDLIIFFNKVANYRRVINISGLDVKRNTRGQGSITASCTATTFIATGDGSKAPTAAAKGGR
jgi:type IV pilus assembly protein PilO